MKRRQKRKLILLVVLLAVLVGLGLWYWNYTQTKNLNIDLRVQPANTLTAPQYLYSFGGTKTNHLTAPVGVLADNGLVFVCDSTGGQIFVFKQDGTFVKTFGKGKVVDPVYLAKNPKDGLLYVTDRALQTILKYTTSGELAGEFKPNLPKAELPTEKTKSEWTPIALAFAPDGTLYVTDILKDQRMLIFSPDGTFLRSVGRMGVADTSADLPGTFQFPNSIKVFKDEVWVADSNNRRIEVFGLDGTYKRLIPADGLPRGMVFLPPNSGVTKGTGDTYAVVDVLASEVTLYSTGGASPVSFGEKGTGDGQFSQPNDITVGNKAILFVSDNKNLRVQAWGWQSQVSPLPRVLPQQPAWCLLALPLLFLPLLFRKRQYYATADFVRALGEAGALSALQAKRVRWLVSEADFEALSGVTAGDLRLAEVLHATEYSDPDARALMKRYAITLEQAATLTSAQRTKLFFTEDEELRKLARMLEIDTMNAAEYLASTASKRG